MLLRERAEMQRHDLLGRFGNLDALGIAADEGEHGALAVAPHAADQGDIDVVACPVSNRVHSIQKRMALSLTCLMKDGAGAGATPAPAIRGRRRPC